MDCTRRIALGMSGGVDSAVAAAMLLERGCKVVGVTLRFLDSPEQREAEADAARVCRRLGIAHHVRGCCGEFEDKVIGPFVREYACGRTPSPCVACNGVMKFPKLLEAADELSCEGIATGHYARVMACDGGFCIASGSDARKDQSYMLAFLGQGILSRLALPLGEMTKAKVREKADALGFEIAAKADSQDICFAPDGYRALLQERGVREMPGDIVDTRGKVLGRHEGLSQYTLGQRKGLGIAAAEPYYVVGKDSRANTLTLGFMKESFCRRVMLEDMNWQGVDPSRVPCEGLRVKLRYRGEACATRIGIPEPGKAELLLESPQIVPAPGQAAVLYQGERVLGGGVICGSERLVGREADEAARAMLATQRPQARRILLVGGMGSGKSTASAALRDAGIPVIDMDKLGHQVLLQPEAIARLSQAFGPQVLDGGGAIDRKALAAAAFESGESTRILNGITHPRIFRLLEKRVAQIEREYAKAGDLHPTVVIEYSAFTGRLAAKKLKPDVILAVLAPLEERVARAVAKGWAEHDVRQRIARQLSNDEFARESDAQLMNDGTQGELRAQAISWWQDYERGGADGAF